MARDTIVGLMLGKREWEWTILARNRDHWSVAGQSRAELQAADGGAGKPTPVPVPDSWRKATHHLPASIAIGLPSDQLLLRVVDLPPVSDEELDGAVRLQADKFSPFPTDTMVISHEVLQKSAESMRVLVAGIREDTLNALTASLRNEGKVPDHVDAAILARWSLLRAAGKTAASGRQVILFVDGGMIEMIVQQDQVPVLFRSTELPSELKGAEFAAEVVAEVGHTLMSVELERGTAESLSCSVWLRGKDSLPVGELQGLFPDGLETGDMDDLTAVSQGLALRASAADKSCVNLVPEAWRSAGEAKTFKHRLILSVASIAGLWALLVLVVFGGTAFEKWMLGRLKEDAAQIEAPAKVVRETRRRVGTIKRYLDKRYSAIECLREICELQPIGIDMTQYSYRKGEALKISGDAQNVEQVYDFKRKLDGSKLLKENSLTGPSLDARKGRYMFEIEVRLPGEDAT